MNQRKPPSFCPVFYNEHYVSSNVEFDTARKAGHVARSLRRDPIRGVELVDPEPGRSVAHKLVNLVHDPAYVRAVETGEPRELAESQGFKWDEGIHEMAISHTMGIVSAVTFVEIGAKRAGSLSSGLHHASFDKGGGYCTYNGLAAAVNTSLSLGFRTLILDFDAHAGGGTWDIVHGVNGWTEKGRVVQLDLSVAHYDTWRPEGDSRLVMTDGENYLTDARVLLDHARAIGPFDIVIYNAGVDPVNCSSADSATIAEREKMVSEFLGDTPGVFTLAGGYSHDRSIDEVVELHRHVIREWGAYFSTEVPT